MKNLFFIILFSSSLITAEAQETQSMLEKNKIAEMESEQPQIAVISLKITKTENQYSVAFTNATILNTIKNVSESSKKLNENDFVCFILDERKQILDTLIIQQPLKVRYEFPKDDETIGSTTVDLLENEVLLRFTYTMQMKYLRVAKVGESRKLIIIDTVELSQVK